MVEACNLLDHLKYLSQNGITLNMEEKLQLDLALQKLDNDLDFEELAFWGKISGVQNDYFIAYGTNYMGRKEFPCRQFYWCTSSNWTFSKLPCALKNLDNIFNQVQTYFIGEFDRTIIDNKGFSEFVHLSKDQAECLPARGITELDRLSFVVSQIDNNCLIVPKGSFKYIPLGEIRRNEAFKGLNVQDAFELKNYVHLRPVQ